MQCDYCSWINQILIKIGANAQEADPVIVVHGGAGRIPRYARRFMLEEVKEAAVAAYRDLIEGLSSLDAVERAIRHMESKKYFNCACGGSVDTDGEIVMDAAVMTSDFRAGCVAAVRNLEHPISLAKEVLQRAGHALLVEDGAQKFASESGIPALPPGQLIASDSKISLGEGNDVKETRGLPQDKRELDKKKYVPSCTLERQTEETVVPAATVDTVEAVDIEPDIIQIGAVGAVAYDRQKRLASGISTAGESGKPYGNVSASCTAIGCGIYVDRNSCVSVSGCDRAVYVHAPAQRIAQRLRQEASAMTCNDDAVATVLRNFQEETGASDVGAIAITADGKPTVSFMCAHFPWAYCYRSYVYYGCTRNEKFSEKIDVVDRPFGCECGD